MSKAKLKNTSHSGSIASSQEELTMESIPPDMIRKIAESLPLPDLINYRATNKTFANTINQEGFYLNKMKKEYGVKDWKSAYEALEYLIRRNPWNDNFIKIKNFYTLTEPYICPQSSIVTRFINKLMKNIRNGYITQKTLFVWLNVFKYVDACFTNLYKDEEMTLDYEMFLGIYENLQKIILQMEAKGFKEKYNLEKKFVDDLKKVSKALNDKFVSINITERMIPYVLKNWVEMANDPNSGIGVDPNNPIPSDWFDRLLEHLNEGGSTLREYIEGHALDEKFYEFIFETYPNHFIEQDGGKSRRKVSSKSKRKVR